MKIAVVGVGYVGLSLVTLLSQYNEVVALDIVKEKIDMINNRVSPIVDKDIQEYFKTNKQKKEYWIYKTIYNNYKKK
mgnify:FL=1